MYVRSAAYTRKLDSGIETQPRLHVTIIWYGVVLIRPFTTQRTQSLADKRENSDREVCEREIVFKSVRLKRNVRDLTGL